MKGAPSRDRASRGTGCKAALMGVAVGGREAEKKRVKALQARLEAK